MNKKERLPEDTNELKEYLTTQVSRRQALSTAGKAAAGIVGLAIIGGGAYAMTQSGGGAAPATVTQTATVTAQAAAAAKPAGESPTRGDDGKGSRARRHSPRGNHPRERHVGLVL